MRGVREIESLPDLGAACAGGGSLRGLRLQDLDLTGHEDELLARTDVEGMVVLGGQMSDALAAHLRTHGALVFPGDPHAPVNPYRSSPLPAARAVRRPARARLRGDPGRPRLPLGPRRRVRHDAFVTLLRAIHDDSISDALDEVIGTRPVAGVMGGHALERGSDAYAGAALLGHTLATRGPHRRHRRRARGDGGRQPRRLRPDRRGASTTPSPASPPSRRSCPDVGAWARVALDVHDDLLTTPLAHAEPQVRSIGIPTWFYGHEPPNVFCTGIAKYFSNALREDGLLARCTAGLVVLEGAAGTVQEVFQSATPLYYARRGRALPVVVLVGRRALDADRPGLAGPRRPWPPGGRWRSASTSSTPSRRPRPSSA